MKRFTYIINRAILGLLLLGVSCAKSDVDDSYSAGASSPIVNEPLNRALEAQGFTLDEDGLLIINDKVRNTTSLDLSGAEITSLAGLNLFSSLKSINLSDNSFSGTIDLVYLPETVEEFDLSGNDAISTYENLATTYSKVTLPNSAKWNLFEILDYAVANDSVELLYATDDGGSTPYTTLREIPSADLAQLIKSLYPSIFDGEKVDLTKSMSEKSVELIMSSEIEDLEGVEYVICRNEYCSSISGGSTLLRGSTESPYRFSANRFSPSVTNLTLRGVDVAQELDLSSVTSLRKLDVEGSESLMSISLPTSFIGSSVSSTNIFTNALRVSDCGGLTTITGLNRTGGLGRLELRDLESLEAVELADITMIHTIILSALDSAQITMPSHLSPYCDGWGGESSRFTVVVALSSDVASQSDVARFTEYQQSYFQLLDYTDYYITNL